MSRLLSGLSKLAFLVIATILLNACSQPVGFEKDGNWLYAPKNYTGKEQWGLFLYISPQSHHCGVPASWIPVLNENHLLYVCPQLAGNETAASARKSLAISAVSTMEKTYAINSDRIYVAGLSGGARIACDLGLQKPDIFHGVIAMAGADFYHAVPRNSVTQADLNSRPATYGVDEIDPTSAARAKTGVRFVFTTGGKDFRQHFIEDIVNGGYRAENFQVRLLDRPKAGHGYVNGATLSSALAFLENR